MFEKFNVESKVRKRRSFDAGDGVSLEIVPHETAECAGEHSGILCRIIVAEEFLAVFFEKCFHKCHFFLPDLGAQSG